MRFNQRTSVFASVLAVLAVSGTANASPSLDIRTPPVVQFGGPSGPAIDPTSTQGQWFLNNNGLEEVRPYEFHDNITGSGGGPNNSDAIYGRLLQVNFVPGTNVLAGYRIRASITNNTPNIQGNWARERNRHQEMIFQDNAPYVGTMFDVKLTSHWSDDGILGNFLPSAANIASSTPAPGGTGDANTIAVNYDSLGWYSYANTAPTGGGSYQVPAWDFGNIAVGQTVTRDLDFTMSTPFNLNAAQFGFIQQLLSTGQDLFINRTRDIKIGQYIQDDPIFFGITDTGAAYPFGGVNNPFGNVSVFHNVPSPGALALLGLGGLVAGRRRR